MEFTNIFSTEEISIVSVDGFNVIDDPVFNRQQITLNALGAARKKIRQEYKNGFKLPDMLENV